MTAEQLPPRNKSQRLLNRKQRETQLQKDVTESSYAQDKFNYTATQTIANPNVSDICFGLNELTDTLSAFPHDIINYFTLLKEIEAKCVYTIPHLKAYIKRFLTMRVNHPKRGLLLTRIRDCIREVMPCLEEKMHVATIASDHVKRNVEKLDQAYDIVCMHEIPEIIRIGPMWEPCMKVTEPKSLQQQRSESRREALAAKKAKTGSVGLEDEYDHTAGEESSGPSSSKKQRGSKKESRGQVINAPGQSAISTGGAAIGGNHMSGRNGNGSGSNGGSKKRKQTEEFMHDQQSVVLGNNTGSASGSGVGNKKSKSSKAKKESKSQGNGAHHGQHSSVVESHNHASGYGNHGFGNENSTTPTSKGKNGSVIEASGRGSRGKKEAKVEEETPTSPINYEGEPVYCYCQQVSYGEMVGCDGEFCEKEWFHLPCTGLKELPKGEWYCDDCKAKMIVK